MSRKKTSATANFPVLYIMLVCGYMVGPDHRAWQALMVGLMVALVTSMAISYVKGDPPTPEMEDQKRKEIRTQNIRALEKDLGMEPMELWSDEDPDMIPQPVRKEDK